MSLQPERSIRIELNIKAEQPELLEGLDLWLRLGLISDAQVKKLCRQYLTCVLPYQLVSAPAEKERETKVEETPPPVQRRTPQPLHSLMAELSVRWLLFLGVFMVVVSSGLLAASQWERFPAFGQYGVLLAYTLVFWAVSYWANRQQNLQLTAQTLQLVTLLLVPVNFWAMDGFRLWNNPVEWLTVAIATIALTGITVLLLRNQPNASRLALINTLGLSYLHWGWKLPAIPVPLIAVYAGTVGTSLATFYQYRRISPPPESSETQPSSGIEKYALTGAAVVAYALTILLFRAIFVARVPVNQLGFAIGICGWLFAWLSQQESQRSATRSPATPWEQIGGILMVIGWLVAVVNEPWQALGVSALLLWFCTSRLRRHWQQDELAGIYIIGLQSVWLVWRLIPAATQEWVISIGTQLVGVPADAPLALLSLALFPYLIFMVWVTDWLRRRQKLALAGFSEQLSLIFGICLTLISLPFALLRTLNLVASSLTLAVVTCRHTPTRVVPVYLTHVAGLLTICSAIDWIFPNLSLAAWATILLGLMLAEWLFSLYLESRITKEESSEQNSFLLINRESGWYIGLVLAGLSYYLLFKNYSNFLDFDGKSYLEWGLVWLMAPLGLTGISCWLNTPRRLTSAWLSTAALFMAQLLTVEMPATRLISLGAATGLMFLNTRNLRKVSAAIITVGFGLSYFFAQLDEGIAGFPRLTENGWLLTFAGTVAVLWLLQSVLLLSLPQTEGEPPSLAAIYMPAVDTWATALCGIELLLLTLHSFAVYWKWFDPSVLVIIAAGVTLTAILYRGWRQPSNWMVYSFGWGLEVLAAETLGSFGREVIHLAITNIALGLIFQLMGDWWQRRVGGETFPKSLHILPLLYGGLGALLRWGSFANWTGLTSLGLALIAIGVGRRHEEFKPLVYLGLIGASVSAYEILGYRITSLAAGDQLIAMAALGTSILYIYRLLHVLLSDYLHFSSEELKFVAHLHWVISSYFLFLSIGYPIQSYDLVGLGTGIVLTRYAIMQGRYNSNLVEAEIWVYLGILEAAGIGVYMGNKLHLAGLLLPWSAAIAAAISCFLYALPWENWGWPKRPWLRSAVVIPTATALYSSDTINPTSLLLVAAFYLFLAQLNRQIRITYLSAFFINWALLRWFVTLNITDALVYITPPALSLLYLAQVDPGLKSAQQRNFRHILRLLGIGMICFMALFTSNWFVCGVWSVVAIFAGLTLRIRAFLYVGTATFLLNAINQLVILSLDYSFMKWIIGLLVGIAFISIAANFETRREQIVALVQNWVEELQQWE